MTNPKNFLFHCCFLLIDILVQIFSIILGLGVGLPFSPGDHIILLLLSLLFYCHFSVILLLFGVSRLLQFLLFVLTLSYYYCIFILLLFYCYFGGSCLLWFLVVLTTLSDCYCQCYCIVIYCYLGVTFPPVPPQ